MDLDDVDDERRRVDYLEVRRFTSPDWVDK